jgi:hypothetical protein
MEIETREDVAIRRNLNLEFLQILFREKGLEYDCNPFLPYWNNMGVYKLWNGLIKIPYNRGDYTHWVHGYSPNDLNPVFASKINILDFHPIHVFLNTQDQRYYDRYKCFN